MAAPIHVKGEWKRIELPANSFIEEGFDNVIALEELHDYEIVDELLKSKLKNKAVKDSGLVPTCNNGKTSKTKLTYKEQKKVRDKIKRKKKRELKEKEKTDELKTTNSQKVIPQSSVKQDVPETKGKKRKAGNDKRKPTKKQKTSKNYNSKPVLNMEELPLLHKYPPDMEAWKNLFVPKPVLWALKDEGFLSPTTIQALSIPHAIRDRLDILGAAETGSGKTLAFSVPILHHVLIHLQNTNTDKITTLKQSPEMRKEYDKGGLLNCENVYEDNAANLSDLLLENNDSDDNYDDDEESSELLKSDDDDPDMAEGSDDSIDLKELLGKPLSDVDSGVDDDGGDELHDDPPTEENYEESGENEFGCVRVINNIVLDPSSNITDNNKPIIGLILEPTRELAIQVKNHLQKAAKYMNVRIATLVGGMAPQKQRRILSKCPEIIIATPGRLWELLQEGDRHLIKIPSVKVLVVDEADRMVEKGHYEELSKLFTLMKEDHEARLKRQTLVFSATLTMMHQGPSRRMKKKKKILPTDDKLDLLMEQIGIKQKRKVIDLTTKTGTAETLTEARINCTKDEKDVYLYYFRRLYPGRTLVFANSKDCLRRLISIFTELGCKPYSLHADMHQKQRLKNLEKFSASDDGFLLASDVAARGLDIPNVQHVIHYQVPRTVENYVHRSGRTARACKEGLSVMLIGQDDIKNYRKIIHSLNRDEELPVFPTEYQYISILKSQLRQALDIDQLNHRFQKVKRQNDWFEKAAEDLDIDIKDEKLLVDIGDSEQQRNHAVKLEKLRLLLLQSLKQPLTPKAFSGKYPTKMGKLVLPREKDNADAITRMKKDKDIQRPMIEKIARNPRVKRVKVKKQKEKKKNKLKAKQGVNK